MRAIIDTLRSLVKPLFNGIFQVLSGGFGPITAILAWAQLVLQFLLAAGHTSSGLATLTLGAVLFIGQAAAALWSFLIVNGGAFEPNPKKVQSFGTMAITAAIVSALFVLVFNGLGSLILGCFMAVGHKGGLVLTGASVAAVQAILIVRQLERLSKRK